MHINVRRLLRIFNFSMWVAFFTLISFSVAVVSVRAEDKDTLHQLSQSEKTKFINTKFESITKVSGLPESVASNLGVNGNEKSMADVGGDFSSGCVGPQNVPRQRMIVAGKSSDRCFVYFERGGIAHFEIIRLYELSPSSKDKDGEAKMIWEAHCSKRYADAEAIKQAIKKDELH